MGRRSKCTSSGRDDTKSQAGLVTVVSRHSDMDMAMLSDPESELAGRLGENRT